MYHMSNGRKENPSYIKGDKMTFNGKRLNVTQSITIYVTHTNLDKPKLCRFCHKLDRSLLLARKRIAKDYNVRLLLLTHDLPMTAHSNCKEFVRTFGTLDRLIAYDRTENGPERMSPPKKPVPS